MCPPEGFLEILEIPQLWSEFFLPPEGGESENITLQRDFYESLQKDFWRFQKSHSSGPSFNSSRGNLKRLPPRGIFYISPLELSWQ